MKSFDIPPAMLTTFPAPGPTESLTRTAPGTTSASEAKSMLPDGSTSAELDARALVRVGASGMAYSVSPDVDPVASSPLSVTYSVPSAAMSKPPRELKPLAMVVTGPPSVKRITLCAFPVKVGPWTTKMSATTRTTPPWTLPGVVIEPPAQPGAAVTAAPAEAVASAAPQNTAPASTIRIVLIDVLSSQWLGDGSTCQRTVQVKWSRSTRRLPPCAAGSALSSTVSRLPVSGSRSVRVDPGTNGGSVEVTSRRLMRTRTLPGSTSDETTTTSTTSAVPGVTRIFDCVGST